MTMNGPVGRLLPRNEKKRAERAGEHPEERGQQKHAVHPIGQQVGGGRGGNQHCRNEHHADRLERDHHGKGEQQHEQTFQEAHRQAESSRKCRDRSW